MKFIEMVGSEIFWNGMDSGDSGLVIVSPMCKSEMPEIATIEPNSASFTSTRFKPSYS